MPRELIASSPGECVLSEYHELPLTPDQIRARSLYSAVKHGTEFRTFQANTKDAAQHFSWEWHRNRPTIISVRSDSEPWLDYGWGAQRGCEEAFTLLAEGRLRADGLIDPVVAMDDVADAYMRMNSNPETGIKLGVDHAL